MKHLLEINNFEVWQYSRSPYFSVLSNIHLYQVFLRFFLANCEIQSIELKSSLLNVLQNLLSLNLQMLSEAQIPVKKYDVQIRPSDYGLFIEE